MIGVNSTLEQKGICNHMKIHKTALLAPFFAILPATQKQNHNYYPQTVQNTVSYVQSNKQKDVFISKYNMKIQKADSGDGLLAALLIVSVLGPIIKILDDAERDDKKNHMY